MTLSQQIGKIIDEKLRAMKLDASKTISVSGDNWSDGTQKVKALNGLSGAVAILEGDNITVSVDGQSITITGDPAENGIPPGGTTNQMLAKNSDDDFDGKWVDAPEAANGLPSGGSTGQALVKKGTTDYMTEWADIDIEGIPTGDGTEDTYMGTLTFSGNTYSGTATVFEMLEDTWVSAIKINPAANDPNVTLNLRTYGSEVKARKTGLSLLGQTYNTIVLDKPIKLYAGSFYVAEFLFSVTQKIYKTTSYLYTGNLWRMLHYRINNFFGTSYSETPGFGLVEYLEEA